MVEVFVYRLKFSLAELYAKADQRGTLRDVPVSESAESAPSERAWPHPEFYNTSAVSLVPRLSIVLG